MTNQEIADEIQSISEDLDKLSQRVDGIRSDPIEDVENDLDKGDRFHRTGILQEFDYLEERLDDLKAEIESKKEGK